MTATLARLLIHCPDRPGIVAAVSGFLFDQGANITTLDQHSTDPEGGRFFMRVEFTTAHLKIDRQKLEASFDSVVGQRYQMNTQFHYDDVKPRTAILVSQQGHALLELLWRSQRGELPTTITTIISNHTQLRNSVESFGIPFVHVPASPDNKKTSEDKILELLDGKTDLIVLARYMQVLSPEFIAHYPERIINIHHSFLPAFVGAKPYHQAHDHGVKLIGATAHYVTAQLDQGPIIEQDVVRVSHRESVTDLQNLGHIVERNVLARAVRWHLEGRVMVDGNKTVVF